MSKLLPALAITAALLAASTALAQPPQPAPIVFFDIAATELTSQAALYSALFGWKAGAGGELTVPVVSPLPGLLRVEPAGQGPVVERMLYVGVPDVNAALDQVKAHGGSVVFGRQVVPGVVILALFKDPAGNRMGLVEMAGGKPIVPPAR